MRPYAPLLIMLTIISAAVTGAFQTQTDISGGPGGQGVSSAVASSCRLIRTTSGTKSSERGGRFIIDDPRSVFAAATDRKLVVYFEWEGPVGKHHIEGLWKNPEGKVVSISDFDYEAKQKVFGAYWTLALPEDIKTGLWALEARIDGEPAGTHTFEVVATTGPRPQVPVKRQLTPGEIYRLAVASTVTVKRLGPGGSVPSSGLGFFVRPDTILTAFDVIDGASSLQIGLPDGKASWVVGVQAWNRVEDWAVLKVDPTGVPSLQLAGANSWGVGDEYFSLQTSGEGTRSIVDGSITGTHDFPDFGKRMHLSFSSNSEGSGAPVLNQYGEIIGLIGYATTLPGFSSITALRAKYPQNLAAHDAPYTLANVLAIPIESIQLPSSEVAPKTLQELASTNQFVPPLTAVRDVDMGTVAQKANRTGPETLPENSKFEYSRRESPITLWIRWQAEEKLKSEISFRVFNISNRLVSRAEPHKFSLGKGGFANTTWKIDISSFPPGLYRVDVMLGDAPAWRSYFRVTD